MKAKVWNRWIDDMPFIEGGFYAHNMGSGEKVIRIGARQHDGKYLVEVVESDVKDFIGMKLDYWPTDQFYLYTGRAKTPKAIYASMKRAKIFE